MSFKELMRFLKNNEKDIVLIAGVILISLISFGAGRISVPGIPRTPITFEQMPLQASISDITGNKGINQGNKEGKNSESQKVMESDGNGDCLLVGSKSSNKYHYPWCSGAKRISEQNKICFSSKQEAEGRGYQPAANCPGL